MTHQNQKETTLNAVRAKFQQGYMGEGSRIVFDLSPENLNTGKR